MTEGNTPKHPAPTALRLDAEAADALAALAAVAGPKTSRHRLMVVALTHGARVLAADPSALLRLLVGVDLAALAAEQRPAATPVAVVATSVAASSTPAPTAAPPSPVEAPPPVEVDAADGDPNRYATAAELARLRRALVAASKRGASILGIATAAAVNTGGSRKALARVKGGESPRVTLRVVSAATAAAEAWSG